MTLEIPHVQYIAIKHVHCVLNSIEFFFFYGAIECVMLAPVEIRQRKKDEVVLDDACL